MERQLRVEAGMRRAALPQQSMPRNSGVSAQITERGHVPTDHLSMMSGEKLEMSVFLKKNFNRYREMRVSTEIN